MSKDETTVSEFGYKNAILNKKIDELTKTIRRFNRDKQNQYFNMLDVIISSDIVIDEKLRDLYLIEKLILKETG